MPDMRQMLRHMELLGRFEILFFMRIATKKNHRNRERLENKQRKHRTMNISDIRADILHGIMNDQHTAILAHESADNDNIIIVTGADGNRYKLTIEKL